jgi:uncharacterized membrane protein
MANLIEQIILIIAILGTTVVLANEIRTRRSASEERLRENTLRAISVGLLLVVLIMILAGISGTWLLHAGPMLAMSYWLLTTGIALLVAFVALLLMKELSRGYYEDRSEFLKDNKPGGNTGQR